MKNKYTLLISILGAIAGLGYTCYRWRSKSANYAPIPHLSLSGSVIPLTVIGSGPAGLSAGLYGARLGVPTVVFQGPQPGGQLMSTSEVENWPGMGTKQGPALMGDLEAQARHCGAIIIPEVIKSVNLQQWPFTLTTASGERITTLAIIMATGATPKKLNIPGESTYWGHGVTTCAVCDAPFYKNRSVVVIGGGDSAAEEALQLAAYAQDITLLVRGTKMRASQAMQNRIAHIPQIKIRYQITPKQILGTHEEVTGIEVATPEGTEVIKTDGVFLAIGHEPNSQLVQNSRVTDEHGYIITAPHAQHTVIPGLFAAGDVADSSYRQAGVASGDGIKAAIDAVRFLGERGLDQALPQIKPLLYDPAKKARKKLLEITAPEQFAQLVTAHKAILIDCYTSFCPSCKTMIPELEAAAAALSDVITVAKINGQELPDPMDRYNVTTVPTLLLFVDGKLIGRHVGALKQAEIEQFIRTYIK